MKLSDEYTKTASLVAAGTQSFRYVEKSNPHTPNLQFLTYGWYELTGSFRAGRLCHPGEGALSFCWHGSVTAHLGEADYELQRYDVLYIPRGATYQLSQGSGEAEMIACRAPADNVHPVFHPSGRSFPASNGASAI